MTICSSEFHFFFFFLNVRKAIQHSFHSKPTSCDYLHLHFCFLIGAQWDTEVFLLWYRDADLEPVLNIQQTWPCLPYRVKSLGGLNYTNDSPGTHQQEGRFQNLYSGGEDAVLNAVKRTNNTGANGNKKAYRN